MRLRSISGQNLVVCAELERRERLPLGFQRRRRLLMRARVASTLGNHITRDGATPKVFANRRKLSQRFQRSHVCFTLTQG